MEENPNQRKFKSREEDGEEHWTRGAVTNGHFLVVF